MTYMLSESLSDSPFHEGPREALGIVNDDTSLNKVLGAYQEVGYELILFKKNKLDETYVFINPEAPTITNPVKPCPCGLNNPPKEILTFRHVYVEKDPRVYELTREFSPAR